MAPKKALPKIFVVLALLLGSMNHLTFVQGHSHVLHPKLSTHSWNKMEAYLLLGTRGMGSSWHLSEGLVGSADALMGQESASGFGC